MVVSMDLIVIEFLALAFVAATITAAVRLHSEVIARATCYDDY